MATLVFLSACGGGGGEEDAAGRPPGGEPAEDVPVVAVPVAPIAGLVDAIAPPGLVETVVLVPRGANPATHEPSLRELRRAATALLYLEIGHRSFVFERTWLSGLFDGSEAERVPLFRDCPAVEDDYHVWLSAVCLDEAAGRIAAALERIEPEAGDAIRANLAALRSRLAVTDSTTEARLAPHRGRAFLVLHPAWGYLSRPFAIEQLSILAHGTGDPGPARLAGLIERARREGVGTIFVQPQFNQQPARLVADELGADVVSLDPLARDPLHAIDEATAALDRMFAARAAGGAE